MTITDIALGLGGLFTYRKFTITYQDLVAMGASATGSINLCVASLANAPIQPVVSPAQGYLLEQTAKMLGICFHQTVQFASTASAISALTLSIGNAVSNTEFTSAQSIFAAPADTTVYELAMFKSGQISPNQVFAYFTATGGNLSIMTAGSVDVYCLYMNVSSVSE